MVVFLVVVTMTFAAVVALASLALVSHVSARRVRAGAQAELARVAELREDLVLVRGKVRIEGDGLAAQGAGARVAIRARLRSLRRTWLSETIPGPSERAGTLWIEGPDRRYRLDGPLILNVGSRLFWSGTVVRDETGTTFAATTDVRDGESVMALGRRCDEDDPGSASYRSSPMIAVLGAAPNTGVIQLVATSSMTMSIKPKVFFGHPVLLLATLLAILPGWRLGASYEEAVESCALRCRESGACHARFKPGIEEADDDIRGSTPSLRLFGCAAENEPECHRASSCRTGGQCSLVDGACVLSKDDDCRHSLSCLERGACSAVDGVCAATRDEDCISTRGCVMNGACSAVHGACVVAKDGDCRRAPECAMLGYCSAVGGGCLAAKNDDCREAERCAARGPRRACSAVRGTCAVADIDCATSRGCATQGECRALDGIYCVPRSDEDCAPTLACARSRVCRVAGGTCVEDSDSCAQSAACRVHGHCGGERDCVPRSDEDCRQSMLCKETGACFRIGDECATSAATTYGCRSLGLCELVLGKWRATLDEHCENSEVCGDEGKCSAVDGVCVVREDDDCRATEGCRLEGECSAVDGVCKASAVDDCRASRACLEAGRCSVIDGRCQATATDCADSLPCRRSGACTERVGLCTFGMTDLACSRAPACKELGDCNAEDGGCAPASSEDCEKSAVCARFGWCELREGRCFVR